MSPTTIDQKPSSPRPVVTISEHAPLDAAVYAMRAAGTPHCIVVATNGKAVGILTAQDILLRGMLGDGTSVDTKILVGDIMRKCDLVATESTTLAEALGALTDQAPVIPIMRGDEVVASLTAAELISLLKRPQAEGFLTRATGTAESLLSTPVMQGLMNLLAEAGI